MISAADKLKAVEREIGLRRRVYPGRVALGRMSPWAAQAQIEIMEAIADDYRTLAAPYVRSQIAAMAAAICETDGVQCQCVRAPETRLSASSCEGPFKQAEAAWLAIRAWQDSNMEAGHDIAG